MNPTEELHPVAPEPPPSVLRRRPLWLLVVTMLAAATLGFMLNELRGNLSWEQGRAERATAAAVLACDQVEDLGYACKADLTNLPLPERGLPGKDGRDGRDAPPPPDAQLDAAVRRWLTAHPPPAGETGATGATGPAGPACPDGWHPVQVQVRSKNQWISIIACVRD